MNGVHCQNPKPSELKVPDNEKRHESGAKNCHSLQLQRLQEKERTKMHFPQASEAASPPLTRLTAPALFRLSFCKYLLSTY